MALWAVGFRQNWCFPLGQSLICTMSRLQSFVRGQSFICTRMHLCTAECRFGFERCTMWFQVLRQSYPSQSYSSFQNQAQQNSSTSCTMQQLCAVKNFFLPSKFRAIPPMQLETRAHLCVPSHLSAPASCCKPQHAAACAGRGRKQDPP